MTERINAIERTLAELRYENAELKLKAIRRPSSEELAE